MTNQVLQLLENRRSHRAYSPEQITEEQLNALLRAGISAPSASNKQPWHFTAVQNQSLLDRISQATHQGNARQEAASRSPRFEDPSFQVFYHAPTVIFISADPGGFRPIDCGIAVMAIAVAAQSMGLGSVILGLPRLAFMGDDSAELEQALGFPEGHAFAIAIAVGKPTDTKDAPERDARKTLIIR